RTASVWHAYGTRKYRKSADQQVVWPVWQPSDTGYPDLPDQRSGGGLADRVADLFDQMPASSPLDRSRCDAAPLTAFIAAQETDSHTDEETETQRRIPG
ncbi:MAG: hypothetical protein AB8B85_01715, partial [Paracoccaceae bacterium]